MNTYLALTGGPETLYSDRIMMAKDFAVGEVLRFPFDEIDVTVEKIEPQGDSAQLLYAKLPSPEDYDRLLAEGWFTDLETALRH